MDKTRTRIAVSGFSLTRGCERGFTLVETLVALAIFGLVAGVFLSGLTVSSKSVMVSQERVAAESLAKSQMESIKAQDYVDDATSYPKITIPPDLVDQGYAIDDPTVEDIHSSELQKITVTVTHNGDEVFTLVDYKVNR